MYFKVRKLCTCSLIVSLDKEIFLPKNNFEMATFGSLLIGFKVQFQLFGRLTIRLSSATEGLFANRVGQY